MIDNVINDMNQFTEEIFSRRNMSRHENRPDNYLILLQCHKYILFQFLVK